MKEIINKYIVCITLIVMIILLFVISVKNGIITDSLYFSLLPLIICSIFDLNIIKLNKQEKLDKKGKLYVIFLTILFILMLSFRQIIKEQIFNLNSLNILFSEVASVVILMFSWAIYLPICVFSTFKVLCVIFCYKNNDSEDSNWDIPSIKRIIKYTFPITILSIIYMLSTYPGMFETDFVNIWSDSVSNTYNNWHPIAFTHFITILRKLFITPYSLAVIQTLVWIYIYNYATYVMAKHTQTKKAINFYIINTLIYVVCFSQLKNLQKDILFSIAMFGLTITILDYILSSSKNKCMYLHMGIFGIMVSLFRHLGIVSVIIALLILVIREFRNKNYKQFKKILILFLIPILSYIIIVDFISFSILNTVENPKYVKYVVPQYLVGAAVDSGIELDNTDINTLEKLMPLEKWKNTFERYTADSFTKQWFIGNYISNFDSQYTLSDILKLDFKFLLKNPGVMFSSYLDVTSILWEISCPYDSEEYYIDNEWSKNLVIYRNLDGTNSMSLYTVPVYGWENYLNIDTISERGYEFKDGFLSSFTKRIR